MSAEVLQLSARLQQVTQAYNGLARLYVSSFKPLMFHMCTNRLMHIIICFKLLFRSLHWLTIISIFCSYKPVLRNIESGLLKMKQDSSLMVQWSVIDSVNFGVFVVVTLRTSSETFRNDVQFGSYFYGFNLRTKEKAFE